MVYGIQASQSVLLSKVGRTLEAIALIKTEERMSRNLQRPELERVVQENVMKMASAHIGRDTLLIIDPSDTTKKYTKKMKYLSTVRDGSEHELGKGYWTLHLVGTELESNKIVPLYQRLWSCDAPGFVLLSVIILFFQQVNSSHDRLNRTVAMIYELLVFARVLSACSAPKGHHSLAQGNALGELENQCPALKGRHST